MNVSSRHERPRREITSIADEPDESLLAAVAAGQEDALGELIRRHRHGVSAVVRRILSCPADAEEVVQDVFVLVWKHAVRFRGEARVMTWIHSIARNSAVSRLRRHRGAEPMSLLCRDRGYLVSQRPDPEREAIASELARRLLSGFARLSAVHRTILVGIVRYRSERRLAERLNVLEGTIKSRLHRARRALRAAIVADPG